MRDYIEHLQKEGQVQVVSVEVDPKYELGAITQRFQKQSDDVLFFENVKGTDFPVATNVYGSRRRVCEIVGAKNGNFCQSWTQRAGDAAGELPGLKSVDAGKRISGKVSDLPLITTFEKDGGPYFNAAIYIAKHPETGVHNLSFHRTMYVDDNEMRSRLGESHDLFEYYAKAQQLGQPLDVAILIGTSPEVFIAACAAIRRDEDELLAASGLLGKPVAMSKCHSVDIDYPSDTQIVIEGRILPNIKKPEGPYGEFMGYYVPRQDQHVFEVRDVHWREGAVFHNIVCGTPEDMYVLDYAYATRIYRELIAKLPGIINVACYPYLLNTIVQIDQQYEGHARHVLLAAMSVHPDHSKTCMVVDHDVDIYDLEDVWWAYLTRGRADKRAMILDDVPGFYRDPHKDLWGRLAIDATMPLDRKEEFQRKIIPGSAELELSKYLG